MNEIAYNALNCALAKSFIDTAYDYERKRETGEREREREREREKGGESCKKKHLKLVERF